MAFDNKVVRDVEQAIDEGINRLERELHMEIDRAKERRGTTLKQWSQGEKVLIAPNAFRTLVMAAHATNDDTMHVSEEFLALVQQNVKRRRWLTASLQVDEDNQFYIAV